jgi:hypothetical protein
MIDDGAGGGIRNGIPYLNASSSDGFSYIEFRWFMGGDNSDYNSPKTQWLYFGPVFIEEQSNYDITPAPGQDIYIPKDVKSYGIMWD